MTVAHKDLTGTDLHEIKGASAATAGQVPIANGTGSAPFGKLDASSLTGTGNPFGANLLHVREEQSSGVNSQTTNTTFTWTTMVLNTTKTNEISGSSLASNQITLPAGTYYMEANVTYYIITGASTIVFKPRLYNITTATTLVDGLSTAVNASAGVTSSVQGVTRLSGRFTLAGTSVIAVQNFKSSGVTPLTISSGSQEVYTDVMIWKVA